MPGLQEADLVGKIQDISRVLTYTNAADTPFASMIKKGKRCNNTLAEYPIDKYDTPRTSGVPDGKDVPAFDNTQKNRAKLYSRVQRIWRNPMVSTMAQDVTDQAGDDGDKMAQSKAKALIELKQDEEAILLGDQDSSDQTDAETGAVTRGIRSWISATAQADTVTAVPAAYRTPSSNIYSGALTSFNEDALRAILQSRWNTIKQKGDLYGFLGSDVKNVISDFTRYEADKASTLQVRRFNTSETDTVSTQVDFYKGDYGSLKLMLDAFILTAGVSDTKAGAIVDMNMVEERINVAGRSRDLPDLGGGPRATIDKIFALACLNPQAHGKIAGT